VADENQAELTALRRKVVELTRAKNSLGSSVLSSAARQEALAKNQRRHPDYPSSNRALDDRVQTRPSKLGHAMSDKSQRLKNAEHELKRLEDELQAYIDSHPDPDWDQAAFERSWHFKILLKRIKNAERIIDQLR
jgi:predicted  nucleic acid-binding Zn-ribbon protein